MKIKRYIDKDMRQVLRAVREDQGPDAVILSTRRVEGGVEVIAAIDYDESLMRQAAAPVSAARAPGGAPRRPADDEAPAPRERAERPDADAETRTAAVPEREVHVRAQDLAGCAPPDAPRPAAAARAEIGEVAEVAELPVPTVPASSGEAAPASLADMQRELKSLRSLLETELSGLLWKRTARRSPLRAQILRNLALIGLAPDVARTIVDGLEPVGNVRALWRDPLARLAQALPVVADRLLTDGGIAALVGPTGVGKTTTVAKLAACYAMQHGPDDVALVCADAFRIGAREHLEAFANIIGVEVHAASDPDELERVLDGLQAKKLVLIDTEGVSQRDAGLAERLAACRREADRVRFYLTLSAASQEAGLDETVRRFRDLPLAAAIVTRIDEAAQLGCIIGTLIRHDLPAAWLSDGQRIPDDLHAADRRRLWLVDRAVECLESGAPRIDERTMAENYGRASAVNA